MEHDGFEDETAIGSNREYPSQLMRVAHGKNRAD
jgi:hypothetical protein